LDYSKFLEGGLDELVKAITHQVPSRLNSEQRLELKRMLEVEFIYTPPYSPNFNLAYCQEINA